MTETAPALPATSSGTALTRFNALRHGVLSRYTLLPWEDEGEYQDLLSASGQRAPAERAHRGALG